MSEFTPHTLSSTHLSLQLLPYGLTFHSLTLNDPSSANHTRDLLVGPQDPADHDHLTGTKGRHFTNQVVGRYANRLPAGVTDVNGMKLDLSGENGVCLHGGKRGLDTQVWTLVDRQSSTLFPTSDEVYPPAPASTSEAVYRHVSPAGADGFPLTVEFETLVQVSEPAAEDGPAGAGLNEVGTVKYVIRAKIVEEGKEDEKYGTPLNVTVHWGFNLGKFDGKEDETVRDHKLYIDSSNVSTLDSSMLATGTLTPTDPSSPLNFAHGSPSDLSTHRTLSANFPPSGIDHNIVLNSLTPISPKLTLTSPSLDTSISFKTNQSSVQIYTAGGMDGTHPKKDVHNAAKGGYPQFGAIFLEFHHPLATFLHPEYAAAAGTDTILKPGEVYENVVEAIVSIPRVK
ncbi:aldose 1-epimerase [Pseudohyphozyma bogoriensis]|nr:aldose 1-epimerase [Pseudohyphozyma bogoriensis]